MPSHVETTMGCSARKPYLEASWLMLVTKSSWQVWYGVFREKAQYALEREEAAPGR